MSTLAIHGGPPVRAKPFPGWPVWDQLEEKALLEVLHSGKWWRFSYGEGLDLHEPEPGRARSRVTEFQEAFARVHQARFGIACANGTAAIEIALKALGIGPGDEVIVPPYTFIATASAVLNVNAIPIFADIDYDTFNLDAAAVEGAITSRTRAIIPVHFAGQMADMAPLLALARARGLRVIEDAAHAHGATWRGRSAGSIGDAGSFSFQASKNMTAGEGGLITTQDPQIAELCESYVWAGRQIGRPWYEHHRLGWNYRLTEFQAAILLVQLDRLAEQTRRRMENAAWLNQRLSQIPGIRPLRIMWPEDVHAWHLYIVRFDEAAFGVPRGLFLDACAAEGIGGSGGYAHPLYRNPMFLNQDFHPHGCPVRCRPYDVPLDYRCFAQACPNAERACREAVWFQHRLLLGSLEDTEDIPRAIEKIHAHRDALYPSVGP
jgi:dTDP-4-amino-4,6-dideoxygalactose transaminase